MERKILAEEIINFCLEYEIYTNSVKLNAMKKDIEKKLDDVAFVENLYNIIFIKARERKTLGVKRITELLIELERTRLKLEDRKSYKSKK